MRTLNTLRRTSIAALGALLLSSLSCGEEPSGPHKIGNASFDLLPQFNRSVSGIVPLAKVRVVLTRATNSTVALDSVIDIAPGADSLGLAFNVAIFSQNEIFHVTMAFVGPAGDTVFRAGPLDVTAATGSNTTTPAPVVLPVTYVGAGSNAKSVAIATKLLSGLTGDTVLFTAIAKDSAGNALPGTPIGWTSLDTAIGAVPKIADGHAVARTLRGTARVVATLLTGPADTAQFGVQPVPTTLTTLSGNTQSGVVHSALALPLVVVAKAADALPVTGLGVQFAAGAGSVSTATGTTDANGAATVNWTLGTVSGAQSATATLTRFPSLVAQFNATGTPTAPMTVVVSPPTATLSAIAATQQFTATVTDTFSNVITAPTILWTSSNVLTSTIGVSGLATAVGVGSATITATAAPASGTATLTVGQASTQLAFTVQPSAAAAGAVIAPPIVVAAKDANGNLVTTFTGNVTIAISTNPGSATLSGTTTVAAVAGLATFANLSISAQGTGYVLTATAATMTAAVSSAFNINAPVATHVVTWANAAGGNWTTAANWTGGIVPAATDTAVISLNGMYTVTLNAAATVGKLILGGGTGFQTLTLGTQTLTVTDTARVMGTGTLVMPSGSTLAGAGAVVLLGPMSWQGGTIGGGPSSLLIISPGVTMTVLGAGGQNLGRTVLNNGTMTFTSTATGLVMGSATAISNTGTIDVQGSLSITNAGPNPATIANAGTFLRSSGAGTVTFGTLTQLANATGGVVDVRTGTLSLPTAGFSNGAGAIITGTGAITTAAALVNAGIINPGASGPGVLKLTGGLSEISTAVLNAEVGGTSAAQIDRVDVVGGAVVAGTLNMALLNGFQPTIGDQYAVMTFSARSGLFTTLNVPTVSGIILDTLWSQGHAIDTLYIRARSNQPSVLLALAPPGILGVGRTNPLNVTLTAPAGAGGVTVNVSSGSTGFVTVGAPGSVTIAQGQTTGQVTLNGVSPGTSLITATASGYQDGTLNVTASNNIISLPTTLNVAFGGTASIPVSLAAAAPTGGTVVTLTTNNLSVVGVTTPTVAISAGSSSNNGTVAGVAPGSTLVIASAPGYISDTTTVSTTASLNILLTSVSINESFGSAIIVQLESNASAIAAPLPGVPVTLTSRNPACAVATMTSVTIPTGIVNTLDSTVYGGSAALPCSTYVVATANNIATDSVQVNVVAKPVITLNNPFTAVGSGLQISASGNLGASNHGGTTVHLVSSDQSQLLLSPNSSTAGTATLDIVIPNNQASFSYFIQGVENATGAPTITATASGFTTSSPLSITVQQPALDITLSGTTTSLSPNTTFQVRVGVPNGSNTSMQNFENIRAGGTTAIATIINSNATAAQLLTAAPGQSVTTTIIAGQFTSPGNAAQGGVEFDPLAAGSTTVSATIPGFITLPTASFTMVVTAPGITLNNPFTAVGSGLQISASGQLGASQHGGVTVHLVSSDQAVLLLSPNSTTAGTGTLDIVIPNNQASFSYFIQGVENATGAPTITATASGFTTSSPLSITVQQPALDITLSGTTTSLSPNTTFQVRVGVPNGSNTSMQNFENIRAGGTTAIATIINSNATAAQLLTAAPGQSVTTTIIAGQFTSPGNAAQGGVEFDPLAAGSTTVSATIPGFITLPTASFTMVVTAPGITLNNPFTAVGSGLQISASGQLGASQHGGVTVHLVSSDQAVLLLSPNSTTAGTGTLDIVIPNNQASFSYFIQGVENATGAPTITATASGFTTSSPLSITVQQPALDITLSGTTTSLSLNTTFQVRVGVPNGSNTSMQNFENIRAGGTTAIATITNSNASAAQLFTTALTGQSVTTTIVAGQFTSPGNAALGGVEFDPLSTGTTTVSATIPGFIALPTAAVSVPISAPGITLNDPFTSIGSGLQIGVSGQLGASQHGGVTVHLVSSNPSVLLLSTGTNVAGTASIDIPILNGATSISYVAQGVEGATGTVSVTASAPGFTDGVRSLTVVQPTLDVSISSPISHTSADVVFQVRVGVPNSGNTSISSFELVRAGSPGLTATILNSNALAAQLVTIPTTGQSVTVQIAAGQFTSAGTVATGGIAFHPFAIGLTTVSAAIAGFLVIPTATQIVTVN